MYLALLKLFGLTLEAIDWVRLHALRYFVSPVFQSGSGNVGERAAKLPLSDWRYPITIVFALIEAVVISVWQVFKWLFFFNTRSIFEFFLSGVKIAIVLSFLSIVGLYGYLSVPPNPATLKHYQNLHQKNIATAILATDGTITGAIPNPLLTQEKQTPGGLYTEMVPPVYWDILDYKTQRQLDFDYSKTRVWDVIFWEQKHYKGISLTGLFDAVNPFSKSASQGLISQLATNLNGGEVAIKARCSSMFYNLCNLLSSIRFARHAFPYLASNQGAELKRWTAIHGNIQGFSSDVRGLRATADVVFNKKPEQLSNAEQALMAVAQLNNEPLLETRDLGDLKNQAIAIATELYARVQPAIVTDIEQSLVGLNLNQSGSQSNLLLRGNTTLGNFTELVEQRLQTEYQIPGNRRIISDVLVTLPVKENEAFRQNLEAGLGQLQRRCANCDLNYKLGEKPAKGGAGIEVVVADQEGQIVRYYRQGNINDRAVGVLSTVPAAVLLATLGNKPDSRFCNQTYRGLASSVSEFPQGLVNCDTPEQRGHSLSFQQALQVRASLPLFYALRKQASPEQLQALYRDFGYRDLRTRAGDTSHGEQLAYEMSYGVVQSTPLQQLDVIHQLGEVLYGRSQSKAVIAISQFLVTDLDEKRRYLEFNKSDSKVMISKNYLRTENAKASLRQLLGHDLNSKNASLKPLRELKNIRFLLTKSGQSYTKQKELRDHWLVASVLIRGRRYSVSAFVGSPSSDQKGLAKKLTPAQVFRPILAEIADSLD